MLKDHMSHDFGKVRKPKMVLLGELQVGEFFVYPEDDMEKDLSDRSVSVVLDFEVTEMYYKKYPKSDENMVASYNLDHASSSFGNGKTPVIRVYPEKFQFRTTVRKRK